jgi:cation diffusion facilitator family transporter
MRARYASGAFPTVNLPPSASGHVPMQATCVAVLVNLALMTVQIVSGWTLGWHAMLADGAHTLVDVAADGVVAFAIYLHNLDSAGRYGKLMPIATGFANLLVVATGAELLAAGLLPHAASTAAARPTIAIAAFSIAIVTFVAKTGLYCFLRAAAARAGTSKGKAVASALRASAWHARADSISSCIAAVGTLGMFAGLPVLDRGSAALIGMLILVVAALQNRDTLRSLFDRLVTLAALARCRSEARQAPTDLTTLHTKQVPGHGT